MTYGSSARAHELTNQIMGYPLSLARNQIMGYPLSLARNNWFFFFFFFFFFCHEVGFFLSDLIQL